MTELFNELSIVGENVEEEDRVVHLLASLPDSYGTLVTALEASEDVPRMEVVTERLLHMEKKLKDSGRRGVDLDGEGAMPARARPWHQQQQQPPKPINVGKGPRCFHCKKVGHIQRNCPERSRAPQGGRPPQKKKNSRHEKVGNDVVGMITRHTLSAGTPDCCWIIDSGATCHISNNKLLFEEYESLSEPQPVTLGDGNTLDALGRGVVTLQLKLPNGDLKIGKLNDVLYVPKLAYNLLSVTKVTEMGKAVYFNKSGCNICDEQEKLVAVASKVGSLYYLNCSRMQQVNATVNQSKENLWHRRFGHLSEKGLRRLAKEKLVNGFDYNVSNEVDFCEPCIHGKIHRSPFTTTSQKRAEEPLGLIHSDICGKINSPSLSQAEYFVTFIDDNTHYAWVYVLKHKHEVFQKFQDWKALVEKSSGHKLRTLRTDNGGEYISKEFEDFLSKEGIRHEFTIPKTPQQNGVSERMNRTLVEAVRSMLSDSKLPHKFWAEALSTAVYLLNRSPTTALNEMTPYEAWTGMKPSVSHLKAFGCLAYAHIPKDERRKLDPKAKKCIHLGYGVVRKGYRLYDLSTSRIIYSRDVVFKESVLGIEDKGEERHLIQVENITENSPEATSEGAEVEENVQDELRPVDDVQEEAELPERTESEDEPVVRRSTREVHCPNCYGVWVNIANGPGELQTQDKTLKSAENDKWNLRRLTWNLFMQMMYKT
jgi:transposase InsO family protein